jgi:hypothetical protein
VRQETETGDPGKKTKKENENFEFRFPGSLLKSYNYHFYFQQSHSIHTHTHSHMYTHVCFNVTLGKNYIPYRSQSQDGQNRGGKKMPNTGATQHRCCRQRA